MGKQIFRQTVGIKLLILVGIISFEAFFFPLTLHELIKSRNYSIVIVVQLYYIAIEVVLFAFVAIGLWSLLPGKHEIELEATGLFARGPLGNEFMPWDECSEFRIGKWGMIKFDRNLMAKSGLSKRRIGRLGLFRNPAILCELLNQYRSNAKKDG